MRAPAPLLYAAIVAALAVFPLLVTSRLWLNMAVFAGIYLVLTVGLTLLFGYANQWSFGHAGFFGIGAYVSALSSAHISVWGGMAVATLACWVTGYAIGRPILRLRGLSLALATFAFGEIMHVLFTELRITRGAIGITDIPSPTLGFVTLDTPDKYYWLVVAVAGAVVIVSWNIGRSHFGRSLRALGANEAAARVAGINVAECKAQVFAYSAALAGLAGALYAHYVSYISADSFRADFSILMVVIVAVGGKESFWGAVLGSIFLTVVPQYLRSYEQLAMLLYGLILIAVFMYLPGGLVSLVRGALGVAR
jgi:branched-chain amino acid transport system permease protein